MNRVLLPIAILVGAVIIFIIMGLFKSAPLKAAATNTEFSVNTIVPTRVEKRFLVSSQGTVIPRTRTLLISEISGAVLRVSPTFAVGGVFKRNEVLMWLDSTDYEVNLERANAELASSNAQFALEEARAIQAIKEWDRTGLPRSKAPALSLRKPYMDEAKAKVQKAKAELKQAKQKLEKTKIRAPYDGMISMKSVDVGHYVSVGVSLGEMFAIDRAEVRLPINEADMAMLGETSFISSGVAANTEATKPLTQVTLNGFFGGQAQSWQATIVRSEGVVDPLNRTQYLIAEIKDPYGISSSTTGPRLLIGSFVTAKIASNSVETVFPIPRSAIYEDQKLAIVDAEQRLRFLPVSIYAIDEKFAYIDDGLKKNVDVIVSAIGLPINGMRVNPTKNEQLVVDHDKQLSLHEVSATKERVEVQ